jgi:hypothetical protein
MEMQMTGQAELIVNGNANATASYCNRDDEMKVLASPMVTIAITKEQKSRAIHFRPKVTVYRIPRLDDLLLPAPETLWYQKSDYANFKTENTQMIQQMILQGMTTTTATTAIDYCARGLEFKLTSSQRDRRRKRLLNSVFAVLDEQELQREEQSQDATFLAQIYNDATVKSQQLAHTQGLEDEQIAREIHTAEGGEDAQKKQATSAADSNKVFHQWTR